MYHISGHQPVQYFNRLPRICKCDVAYILDPVVATAATIMSVVAILKKVCLCVFVLFCVFFLMFLCFCTQTVFWSFLFWQARLSLNWFWHHYWNKPHGQWGVSKVHLLTVIASREGLKTLIESHPDLQITVGTIDDKLSDKGKVLPGLGDSGDRQVRDFFCGLCMFVCFWTKRKLTVLFFPFLFFSFENYSFRRLWLTMRKLSCMCQRESVL